MSGMHLQLKNHQGAVSVGAIVLGGGRGTRLYPLTALRAKPAVPLLGRYRLIDIPLSNCIHSGIRRIFVLTQFNSASLNRHINNSYKFDNFSRGFVEILAAEQTIESGDWFQGTADAVRQNLRHVRNMNASHYLILSGDQLYRMDYSELLATHVRKNADMTIAVLPVDREAAKGFGILKTQRNGRIAEFVEKPQTNKELAKLETSPEAFASFNLEPGHRRHLASMGIYAFKAEVLEKILEERQDWIDFGKHVIPNSLKSHRVFSHIFMGFWEDIGTVRSYYETHMELVKGDPPFQFYEPRRIIYTRPRYLPGSRLQDAVIKDSIICDGSRVSKAHLENSIIGIRSIIHPGVHLQQTIVMGADYFEDEPAQDASDIPMGIGAGSRISGAIIDKNARIGKNVVIRGARRLRDRNGDGWAIRDGLVVVLKIAIIPDGTRIG